MSFASELRETPGVLRDIRARFAAGDLRGSLERLGAFVEEAVPGPVLLTGMGSSYFAGHYAACLLERASCMAMAVDTGEFLTCHPSWVASPCLKVVISQSGRSGEVLDLLDRRPRPAVDTWVALTNDDQSPLGTGADAVVSLGAGPEKATASKTYFATIAVLALAVHAASRQAGVVDTGLEDVAAEMERRLADAPSAEAVALADHVAAGRNLIFLGKGTGWCAAQQAALIVQEALYATATAATYGQWRHGPSERADAMVALVAFPTAGADPEVARTLVESESRGAAVVRLPGDDFAPWRLSFDPIVPVYEALLEVGRRRGVEVGQLSHKVTGR